jgi:hypothetical protein
MCTYNLIFAKLGPASQMTPIRYVPPPGLAADFRAAGALVTTPQSQKRVQGLFFC